MKMSYFIMLLLFTPSIIADTYDEHYNSGNLAYIKGDYNEAFKQYTLGSINGDDLAQYQLGRMYLNGKGVTKNIQKAKDWFVRSAENGNSHAQFELGLLYRFGDGVLQDHVQAYKWFNLASIDGFGPAVSNRDYLYENMTKEQIAEAQKLARECVAKDYKGC